MNGTRAPRLSLDEALGGILAGTHAQAPTRKRQLPKARLQKLVSLAEHAAIATANKVALELEAEPAASSEAVELGPDAVALAIGRQSMAHGRDRATMGQALGIARRDDGSDFFRVGQGPDLLLLGPPGVSPYFLAPLAAALGQGFRVHLWSPPGDDPETAGLSRAVDAGEMRQALATMVPRLLIRAAPVVAWCGGARLAAALVEQKPEWVSSVSLLAPDLGGDLRGTGRSIIQLYEAYLGRPDRTERHLRALGRVMAEGDLIGLEGEDRNGHCVVSAQPLEEIRPLIGALLQPSAALAHYARYVVDDLLRRPSERLHASLARRPCQVVFAEDDDMIDNQRAAERLCFSSELRSVSFAGHYFVADRADLLARHIGEFIARASAQQRADELESTLVGAPVAASMCI